MVVTAHSKDSCRVLILEPSGNLWGSERVLLDFLQIASASPSAWKIAVCCPPNSPIIPRLSRLPIKVFPTFIANLHLKTRAHRLSATINFLFTAFVFRPKLLYVNQAGATKIALLVARILRLPVIAHVRLAEDVQYIGSLGAKASQLQSIVCVSNYMLGLLKAEDNLRSNRLRMLYDPYSPRNNWNGKDDMPQSAHDNTVSCVGRLTPIKGQDILLRAISSLRSEGVFLRVLMVGASPAGDGFETKLRELARTLEISDQVTWLGYQDDVFTAIHGSMGQVCPSHQEPLGRVIFEAWDAGLVPISWSGAGGSAEAITDSKGGMLYDDQDAKSLAVALRTLLGMNTYQRQQMIRKGRGWLRKHCDPEEFSHSMFAVWQDALDTHRNDYENA